ncbi:hypothetical protein BU16DRAFT_527519 [Lophium mytilinum]|uniref:Uncharacterized protein n=1 Tax=Lophium mytilinum TaxID=390894 RepID=A0A6A6QQB8_9PEZI|nr:hypothetical protein BU16DRAFT_527519 [Lophium mytilinum]
MLDENLPTFYIKPSTDAVKHHQSFYYTQYGSEPEASYSLHYLDPSTNEAKNTYAAAIFDAHNPDVLFAEILVKPGWTQPSLSQEDIRRNGGVPPPPQPIMPTEFAIQLYNPDQEVMIRQQTGKWGGSNSYEFSMPQSSFRTPSASTLDRSQNDPAADAATPKILFVWRKESKLSKNMTCFLTGKSTDPTGKKNRSKEPDIAIAMFEGLKAITILESNLYRVDMEDYKGLEVVLLLGAAAIRDIYFGDAKAAFHIIDPATRKNSGGIMGRKNSSPIQPVVTPPLTGRATAQPQFPLRPGPKGAATGALYNQSSRNETQRQSLPPINTGNTPPPRFDPRKQWEIEAETARLKAQVEAEDKERKRLQDIERRKRLKAEEEESKKTKRFLETEEREQRRRQAQVDKETERLRRKYGDQGSLAPPAQQSHRHSTPSIQFQAPIQQQHRQSYAPAQPPGANNPYLQAPAAGRPTPSQSSFFGGGGTIRPDNGQRLNSGQKKKSFWRLRSHSELESPNTLRKKQSSMF